MLIIEHCDMEETLSIGDLFESLGFNNDTQQTDDSGDSYLKSSWGIEVKSLDGYYHVEGFRWTKPEKTVKLIHFNEQGSCSKFSELKCADEHLVFRLNDEPGWVFVKDLSQGDLIVTENGKSRVYDVDINDEPEQRLCDLQVSIAHSYFTNGVLSHNSHFLTMLGANALRLGKNVLHYTFELNETSIGIRYDSNLCDIDSNEIIDNKDKIRDLYANMKMGRLKIKEFPTSTASIQTLRAHIERLSLRGFDPDILIIDYADIMRSTRQMDSLRHELKLIYEELRGFGQEKNIPIWTASQSNKEGADTDVVDLTNMSESYGKAMVADVVLTLSRRSYEKATGAGRLYVAKNRAGKDGLLFNVLIDTARSKFKIEGASDKLEASVSEETALKQRLKNKWTEIQEAKLVKQDDV